MHITTKHTSTANMHLQTCTYYIVYKQANQFLKQQFIYLFYYCILIFKVHVNMCVVYGDMCIACGNVHRL